MTMSVAVGETPIFDELREALGMLEIEELIGHPEGIGAEVAGSLSPESLSAESFSADEFADR
jgi:hypothetical protein